LKKNEIINHHHHHLIIQLHPSTTSYPPRNSLIPEETDRMQKALLQSLGDFDAKAKREEDAAKAEQKRKDDEIQRQSDKEKRMKSSRS
jgi:hypothetical protein